MRLRVIFPMPEQDEVFMSLNEGAMSLVMFSDAHAKQITEHMAELDHRVSQAVDSMRMAHEQIAVLNAKMNNIHQLLLEIVNLNSRPFSGDTSTLISEAQTPAQTDGPVNISEA